MIKALRRIHKSLRKTLQQLLFLFLCNDRSSLDSDPFGHKNVLTGLRARRGYQPVLPDLSHPRDAYHRLGHSPRDLRMASHDLNMKMSAGFFHLAHHFPDILFLDFFRQKHGQHDAHRLRPAAGQIVRRDLNRQHSHILHGSRDRICGNHKNLPGRELYRRAVLAYAGSQKHLVPLCMNLFKYASL